MLLWTLGCVYLFKLVILLFLDLYPGVELQDHVVVLFLILFMYLSVFGGAGSLLLQGWFSPAVMLGLPTVVVSLVEHRLSGRWGSGVVAPRL